MRNILIAATLLSLPGMGCAAKRVAVSTTSSPLTHGLSELVTTPREAKREPSPHQHTCPLHPAGTDGVGATLVTQGRGPLSEDDALRLMTQCYDIPVVVHPRVKSWIRYYQTRGRDVMRVFLERYGRYGPVIRAHLAEVGLPEDLVFVAMAESGLSDHAVSAAGAVGPWQFIRATARRYELGPDEWVDPRRDPELATEAAAAHLRWLYQTFGDWHLAAAGYNAGAGKIRRARRIYHSDDYWEIRKAGSYLRPETKEYVPKILALALITKHPDYFGFSNIDYQQPLVYDQVTVHDATSLAEIAELAGTDLVTVQALNPALLQFCTPPKRIWSVRVPAGTAEAVRSGLLEKLNRYTYRRHVVRRGETIARIAKRFGTDAAAVMRINGIRDPRSLEVGTSLIIPVPSDGVLATAGSGNDGEYAAPAATE